MELTVIFLAVLVGVIAAAAQFYGTRGPLRSWKRWTYFVVLMGFAFALLVLISVISKASSVTRGYWIAGAVLMLISFLGAALALKLHHRNSAKEDSHAT